MFLQNFWNNINKHVNPLFVGKSGNNDYINCIKRKSETWVWLKFISINCVRHRETFLWVDLRSECEIISASMANANCRIDVF